jgi:hypothetical protein
MLALSIRQPWAWFILHGGKPVENRRWRTRVRGRVLLHAAKGMTTAEYWAAIDFVRNVARKGQDWPAPPSPQTIARGGIVGSADLIDCVNHHDSPWFSGPYGFVLANVQPVPFLPCIGKLGFFDLDIVQLAAEAAQAPAEQTTGSAA